MLFVDALWLGDMGRLLEVISDGNPRSMIKVRWLVLDKVLYTESGLSTCFFYFFYYVCLTGAVWAMRDLYFGFLLEVKGYVRKKMPIREMSNSNMSRMWSVRLFGFFCLGLLNVDLSAGLRLASIRFALDNDFSMTRLLMNLISFLMLGLLGLICVFAHKTLAFPRGD